MISVVKNNAQNSANHLPRSPRRPQRGKVFLKIILCVLCDLSGKIFYSSLLRGENKTKEESNEIFPVCDWNGNDSWRASLFCISWKDEVLGAKGSWNAGQRPPKIRFCANGYRTMDDIYWERVGAEARDWWMLECWNAGMLEFWNSGMLEFWNAGIEGLGDWGIRGLRNWKKMNIEHRTSNIEHWMGKDEETELKNLNY